MKNVLVILMVILMVILFSSCTSTKGRPLTYVGLDLPKGKIRVNSNGKEMETEEPRGGWHFFNHGFRPAPSIRNYVENHAKKKNTKIFKNLDVQLNVPFSFSLIFVGYNKTTDRVYSDFNYVEDN